MVDLDVMLTGLGPALDALDEAVLRGTVEGVTAAAETVAHAARADHAYADRTGALTASIEALPAERTERGAQGGVLAAEDYASRVEARGFAFLGPAFERSRDRIDHDLEDALDRAVRRGGLT